MAKIYDARDGCGFSERKLLFDTNIWIAIDGVDPRPVSGVYSDYYSSVLKSDNEIVVNDYIISEFFNRVCRLNYKMYFPEDDKMRHFKINRKGADFRDVIESVRDSCLNMIDDCFYEPAVGVETPLMELLDVAGTGELDFTDVIILNQCKKNGYVLVTDDFDYHNCGLDIVTANRNML